MKDIHYSIGNELAVVREGLAILVDDHGSINLSGLWGLANSEPDVLSLIDVLSAGRLSSLPAFASVIWNEKEARIVVRGSHIVELAYDEGVTRCHGAGVSTWTEHLEPLDGVRAIRLLSDDRVDTESLLPIDAAVVKAAAILIGALKPTSPTEPGDDHRGAATPVDDPSTEATADPPAEPVFVPPDEGRLNVPMPPTEDASATLVEADESRYDAQWGATVAGRQPEDAAVRDTATDIPEATLLQAAPITTPGDHDHHTMTPEQFARLKVSTGSAVSAPPPPPSPSAPIARLTFSTGKEVLVDQTVLVGRAPQARNTTSGQLPVPVVVNDPYVSSTHVEFAIVEGRLFATDVSSNGTVLQAPGTASAAMSKGHATPVADGSFLHLADGVAIEVTLL